LLTLIVQIVLGLALLVGLVTIIMSNKNWHWSQLVLVLFTFFAAVGFLFLGAETVRIHKTLRANIPSLKTQIAGLEKQNDELLNGSTAKPGIRELDHRLLIAARERGRVWRGVAPAGQIGPQGQVSVEIANPQPHGLEKDAILYAFEAGEPDAADPASKAQYLGEFRVSGMQQGGVALEPVQLMDNRASGRLAQSQGPWSLYETMPIDRHRLFAGFTPEQLQSMLPSETVDEYVRHGTEATDDDDEWHVVGLDADGRRLGPENIEQAVKKLYDRYLRDYAFLFGELASQKIVTIAKQAAVAQDNAKLTQALTSAQATGEFRQQQIAAYGNDLTSMQQDLAAIQAHRDAVLAQRDHLRQRNHDYQQANSELAKQLTEQQLGLARYIDGRSPPAAAVGP